jgi:MOSC domain-containing protein YiiM
VSGSIVQISTSRGGVPKHAIPSAEVNTLGIIGDACAHPDVHGGPLQAVLLVTSEGIDELIAAGYPLFFGALGENLTTRGLDRHAMRFGQRYRVGDGVVIELTKLREPCNQLSVYGFGIQRFVIDSQAAAGDPQSPRWGLGGFYAAVVAPGTIRTGDPIELL